MRTRLLMLTAVALAALLGSSQTVTADQLCGCKRNSNGRLRRITAGAPLTCRTGQTLVCWNEDPPPGDISTRVYNTADITIPNNSAPALTFNAERWDTATLHDTATNNDRLTASVPGKYYIFGHVSFYPSTTGIRELSIHVNGGPAIAIVTQNPPVSPVATTRMSVSTHYELAAGDYVTLHAFQDRGAPLDVLSSSNAGDGNFSPEFGMVKLP